MESAESENPIPMRELSSLELCIDAAADLAAQRQLVRGYEVLETSYLAAIDRAEDNEPWVRELVLCYRLALLDYCHRYGVNLD